MSNFPTYWVQLHSLPPMLIDLIPTSKTEELEFPAWEWQALFSPHMKLLVYQIKLPGAQRWKTIDSFPVKSRNDAISISQMHFDYRLHQRTGLTELAQTIEPTAEGVAQLYETIENALFQ